VLEGGTAGTVAHAVGDEGEAMRSGWTPTHPSLLEDLAAGGYPD
jgi:hypothetical protein